MEDILEGLLRQDDTAQLSRRDLLGALATLVTSRSLAQTPRGAAPFRTMELNHVTLRVSDLDRSKKFYQALLGLPVLKEDKDLCYLGTGRGFLALWRVEGAETVGADHWCVGLDRFDREAARARLEAAGYHLRHDPDDSTLYVLDPDGLTVQLEAEGFKA
ncbi:MAG TPA: VOC family protein [Gemmatimonadales bacterium]|nr:VOC family protein [Gemmatimonadales bacterium]